MATSKDFLLKITKLNGANYRDWAFNIRLYLESMHLFGQADRSVEIEPEQQIHVRPIKKIFLFFIAARPRLFGRPKYYFKYYFKYLSEAAMSCST